MQSGIIRDDQFTRFMEAGNAICYEFEFQGEHYSENSPVFQEALELSRVIWNHFDVTVETAAAVFLPTELAELLEISQRIDTPFSFLLKRDILESKKPRIGIFTDRNGKKHYHDPGFPRLVDDCVRITRLAIDDLKALKPEAARPFLMKLQKDLMVFKLGSRVMSCRSDRTNRSRSMGDVLWRPRHNGSCYSRVIQESSDYPHRFNRFAA